MEREKSVVVYFFNYLINQYEFELIIDKDENSQDIFRLKDLQSGNLGGIEQEEFLNLADILERLEIYHQDYIYNSLEKRENNNEIISKDDWDLTVKRFTESNTVADVLTKIYPHNYKEISVIDNKYDIKNIIEILDKEEIFYKSVCEKYINTKSKEILFEIDDKILRVYIEDKYIPLKEDGKIVVDNYKQYLDNNFIVEQYRFYKELYNDAIKNDIFYDLKDLGLFDKDGNWDFYITFDELKKIGYGYMVKDNYPLLEKYAIPEGKQGDFYENFSLEQLDNFEETLHLYYETEDIDVDEANELYSKSNNDFNSDIIRLSEGLISYEDFIEDYVEHLMSYYDLSLSKVIEYFRENKIKDLMEYGSDGDEGLYHLSSMYQEIMDKLNIKYSNIYTEDGASDGKYITTITFENNFAINIDTSAFNGIKVVTKNVESIYESYENLKENFKQNEVKNEDEFEYNFN